MSVLEAGAIISPPHRRGNRHSLVTHTKSQRPKGRAGSNPGSLVPETGKGELRQALKSLRKLIAKCSGVLIIHYTRIFRAGY